MPQVINTNIASMNSQRNLNTSQTSLATALQRLSSGLRINSAKDDAAGLAISERMTSQIRGLNQAVRNANDGISLAQTAESALGEVGNILQRMRELSIQSANATNSDSDRVSLQQEVTQLKSELTRIADSTTFNGQKILNGAAQNIQFQVGAEANQTIGISIGDARSTRIGSQVVTNSNTDNGLQRATFYNRFATEGTNVGKVDAAATIAAGTTSVAAQTLTIRDASGAVLQGGTVKINAADQISVIADRLNAVAGSAVRAEGSNYLKLANWVAAGTTGDAITLEVQSGNTSATVTLNGVDSLGTQADIFNAARNAINGSADLSAAGVVAGLDGAGNLIIRNNTGADLGVRIATSGAATVDALGSDTANTTETLTGSVAASDSARVGGRLSIFLANGYSVESDVAKATGLFDASAASKVSAKETGVGIGNVLANDSRTNLAGTFGYVVGKALGSTAAAVNAYGAQTLKIRDAAGTLITGGSVTVAVNSSAKTIAGNLNSVAGVSATASTKVTLSNFAEAGAATDTITVVVGGQTVINAAIWDGFTQKQAFEALRDGINSNTTLAGQGYAATIDKTGNLVLTNSEGRDIAMSTTGVTAAVTMDAVGSDRAATVVGLTSTAATDNLTVGGSIQISLAEGYTIESTVAGAATADLGLLSASASAAVKTVTNNVNYGNAAASQTLTINGTGQGTVAILRDDTADIIAAKINSVASSSGVTAEARTQAKLSDISGAGTVAFTLNGQAIAGAVTGAGALADLSALAASINAKSDKTGVAARLTDNNAALILESKTGANISISDFSHSGGSVPTSTNISGIAASIKVAGLAEQVDGTTGTVSTSGTTATTLYSGGISNAGADSTVVGGTVFFRASGNFDVRSSQSGNSAFLVGGNSSLFKAETAVANTSSLSSVNGVDVSSVDGANNAISVIDFALTQVNNVRGALGGVQNRFESTIASLSAGSENLSAARSRIRDADFAMETANLTRSQILQQAGVAMLAQANQLPQLVLSLLQ